jgi:hypothetical protein
MVEFPDDLLAVLPSGSEDVTRSWWDSLSETDRARIATLWDERIEVQFFTPQEDESGTTDDWEQVPCVHGGRFVPTDDDGRAEWFFGFFEHLLEHPELMLAYELPTHRVIGVCTQHVAARKCLADGDVPVNFTCPLRDSHCPLLPLRGATLSARK